MRAFVTLDTRPYPARQAPPCTEAFDDILSVLDSVPQVFCLSAPTPVGPDDAETIRPRLGDKLLAGASEAVGEIAVL